MDVKAEKICRECHTRTTPLWRAGPDGPRSLCNACGLRFRKRMALPGLNSAESQKRRKRTPTDRVKKIKEEEEAAISLMALSCGFDARSQQETTYPFHSVL